MSTYPARNRALETRLANHYRAERTRTATIAERQRDEEGKRTLKALVALAKTEAPARGKTLARTQSDPQTRLSLSAFVLGQARFIHPGTWILQVAFAAFALTVYAIDATTSALALAAAGVIGAATVAAGLPSLAASKTHGMVELEYACRFDCASVTTARLVLIGCSNVLVLTVVVLAAPPLAGTNLFSTFVHACGPYFLACGGCLAATRRASAHTALTLSAAWVGIVVATTCGIVAVAPSLYSIAATWIWTAVATASFIWTLREARLLVTTAANDLAAFSPHHQLTS